MLYKHWSMELAKHIYFDFSEGESIFPTMIDLVQEGMFSDIPVMILHGWNISEGLW